MLTWPSDIKKIRNGEPVSASVANRSAEALELRTAYLKKVLEAFQAGRAIVHWDAPLDALTEVGLPVYWNESNNCYSPAKAQYAYINGVQVASDSARCLGIVVGKTSESIGAVCLTGMIEGVSISGVIGEEPQPGVYYLGQDGGLTIQKPPLAVPVLYARSNDTFWVLQAQHVNEHQHYMFWLESNPANVAGPSESGGVYTIPDPDSSLPGWLPADDLAFDGLEVPQGAKFGYNIDADASLVSAWPPMPPEGAVIVVDGRQVINAQCGDVVINVDGIWWMKDGVGEAPWPDELGSEPCNRLQLQFVKLAGMDASAFVNSIRAELPLVVSQCSTGDPATRGHLLLTLSPYETSGMSPSDASIASISGNQVTLTPTVAGVRATGLASVSGGEVFEFGGDAYRKGLVTLHVSALADSREGDIEMVNLVDVAKSSYQDVMYLRFPQTIASSIVCKITVPSYDLPPGAQMTLSFWLMATASGTLPSMSLSYRKIPSPGTGKASLPLVGTDLADIEPSPSQAGMAAWQYIHVQSEAFSVEAGDIIFFELARQAGDGYNGDVGLLQARWNVTAS